MIFFYDLQTTGFSYSNKKIDIIERHFEEYSTSIVISTGLLKPIHVPFIPFNITTKTGITKEDVYENGDNIDKFKDEIKDLFTYCKNPIFISHNGNNLNHKILLNEKIISYNNCKLLDSKVIISLFLNDIITNKSLSDIHKHLFNSVNSVNNNKERANLNIKMLLSIFHKLNINEDKILNM